MTDPLVILLRAAGVALILLAALHPAIGWYLKWPEEAGRMSLTNSSIFKVHTFFICVTLVMMGLPCVVEPRIFLESSRAGLWLAWSFSAFWAIRLFCQWLAFPWAIWRGKWLETRIHVLFSLLWLAMVLLFFACGLRQLHGR